MIIAILGFSLISNVSFASQEIIYGVIQKHTTLEVIKNFQMEELALIKSALNKPVKLKIYTSFKDVMKAINKNPDQLSLIYVKHFVIPELAKYKQWQGIAQVLSTDPSTHKLSATHSSYLITSKNSSISKLDDLSNKTVVYYNEESASDYLAVKKLIFDHKIHNVKWIKAKDINSAHTMIKTGKADVMGEWHYKANNENNFKVIYKINDLQNPWFYANTKNLSTDDINKLKEALKTINPDTHNGFTYN
jgi:ABC-type phosphate/phosphonate transport system substrate-binding protein